MNGMGQTPATPISPLPPVGVIHGRFQILHNDHLRYLLAGNERCHFLIVGITNPDPYHTRAYAADPHRSAPSANPLTYFERALLVTHALREAGVPAESFITVPFPINLPELCRFYVPLDAVFFLTVYDEWGRRKLQLLRELGLRTEVLWERPPEEKGLSGATVRRLMREGRPWRHLVPPACARLLEEWDIPQRLRGHKDLGLPAVEGRS